MISTEEITKISHLAKFNLTPEDISHFQIQLTNIMEMIDVLIQVDCSKVEPLTSVCNMNQRMRKDIITESDIITELFANVSGQNIEMAKEINCFIVPKVME